MSKSPSATMKARAEVRRLHRVIERDRAEWSHELDLANNRQLMGRLKALIFGVVTGAVAMGTVLWGLSW